MYATATLSAIAPFLFVSLSAAFVIPSAPTVALPYALTLTNLTNIMPSSTVCDGSGAFAAECITAAAALGPISRSFSKYQILNVNEAKALLAWIALESGELKFNNHHFPGPNPGQGTRNMMSPGFVAEYAVEVLPGTAAGTPASAVLPTLNQNPDLDFGSAAWFYARKCTEDVKNAVRFNGLDGFQRFTTECVVTGYTPDRVAYRQKADLP